MAYYTAFSCQGKPGKPKNVPGRFPSGGLPVSSRFNYTGAVTGFSPGPRVNICMNPNKKFKDYCEEIMDFYRERGVKIDPAPTVVIKTQSVSRFDPFPPTGNYDFTT